MHLEKLTFTIFFWIFLANAANSDEPCRSSGTENLIQNQAAKVDHPRVEAEKRLSDLKDSLRPSKNSNDILRSLEMLEELTAGLRGTHSQLVLLLGHRDAKVRRQAAIMLGEVSRQFDYAPNALKQLTARLDKETDPEVTAGLYLALSRMGPYAKPALPRVREGRKHEDPRIRRAAYVAISRQLPWDTESLMPDVIAALDDPDDGTDPKNPGTNSVSWMAFTDLRVTCKTSARSATAKLVKIVQAKKGNAEYELHALAALATVNPEERLTRDVGRSWLKNTDTEIVKKGAGLLALLGPHAKDAVPDLIDAAQRKPAADPLKEQALKIVIAEAFRHIGPAAREALPTLRVMATTDDVTLREHVFEIIKELERSK